MDWTCPTVTIVDVDTIGQNFITVGCNCDQNDRGAQGINDMEIITALQTTNQPVKPQPDKRHQ